MREIYDRYDLPRDADEGELVEQYLPIVYSIVGNFAGRLPWFCELEDIRQAAMMGLLSAVRSYNGKASFATYAHTKIRWEIKDEIRRMAPWRRRDWDRERSNMWCYGVEEEYDDDERLSEIDNFDEFCHFVESELGKKEQGVVIGLMLNLL